MEIGLYSFAENTPDPLNGGHLQSPAERLMDLLEEIELADQVGLDFYGLGEHHRPDFVASAPVTILAAAAARTKTHPPLDRRDRAELGRPDPRLAAVRDPRPAVQRPRRDHGRPRLVHRELPALRLRTRRLRHAVRGKARRAAQDPRGRQGQLAGLRAYQAHPRHRDLPQARAGPAAALGRRWRHAQLGRPRRLLRPAADDRHHRRPAAAIRAAGRTSTATPPNKVGTTPTRCPSASPRTASSPTTARTRSTSPFRPTAQP